ncbi:MAG: tetratricopeptide repeat protein [Anaerolineales bacterium]
MPGRFSNLEFDDEQRAAEFHLGQDVVQRDEQNALDRAQEENRWGRFEAALRMYTRCLQENRAAVPAWVGQVQMLVELGEYHEARVWSDKALELFRNNGELLAAKAQACARLKDLRSAIQCSDGALQSPGSSPWRWQARGEVLLAKGQRYFDECFLKAVSEPTADWFDRVIVARIYLYYGRATNALHFLKQALELEPAHGYIWFEMGNCQRQLGMISAARTDYERCLELRSDYREAKEALHSLRSTSPVGWLRGVFRRWGGR